MVEFAAAGVEGFRSLVISILQFGGAGARASRQPPQNHGGEENEKACSHCRHSTTSTSSYRPIISLFEVVGPGTFG